MNLVLAARLHNRLETTETAIFLAGGISGCENWQVEMTSLLNAGAPGLVTINPRRADFNVAEKGITEVQIKWEHDHLRKSKAILFWFPSATLCPITLYELGTWSALASVNPEGPRIFVGVDPKYLRKEDVLIQTGLILPQVHIVDNLKDLAKQVVDWYLQTQ